MKQFIKKFFLFLFVVIPIYPFLIFIWFQYINPRFNLASKWPETHFTYTNSYIKHINQTNYDFISVGSSHAYCSFNPEIFEKNQLSLLNLASPNQTPYHSEMIINNYLSKYKSKYVLYEVYPNPLVANPLEASIDFSFNFQFNNRLDMILDFLIKNPSLIIFHGIFYNYLAHSLKIDNHYDSKNFYKTYSKNHEIFKISSLKSVNPNKIDINIFAKQFHSNIQLLKSKNFTPILIYAPIPHRLYKSYSNKDDIDNFFKQTALAHNIKYFNFNNLEVFKDDEHFFDNGGHLNYNGGLIFNNLLIDSLKKHQLIP